MVFVNMLPRGPLGKRLFLVPIAKGYLINIWNNRVGATVR
jgi:hypothetical protein